MKHINVYQNGDLVYREPVHCSSFKGFRYDLSQVVDRNELSRTDEGEVEVKKGRGRRFGFYAELMDNKDEKALFSLFFNVEIDYYLKCTYIKTSGM